VSERPPYRLPRHVTPQHYALVLEPDLGRAEFDGEATIDVTVHETTNEIVVNAAELEITDVELRRSPDGPTLTAVVSYVKEEEQAVLTLPQAADVGQWQLRARFKGQLNDKLRGFYRSKYKAENGDESWIAVTQFESTDARRAFPCWDEPDLKATFGITIVADEGLTVLSNARQVSSGPAGAGKRRVAFADTMKMSTYLVAMAIGPFELTDPVTVEGAPLRIASVPGRAALRDLAGRAAAHALRFLTEYFSIPYPADKLDHIGIPDFAAGAMENLGLVTYRETALLVAEDSAQTERQRVVSVIAHETAHMWFGDLVTMRWWEGLWLNEAFASFMELLVTDAFEPNWRVWDNFGVDRNAALATDSLRSTRSIEYPVGRPEEAEDMFDVITYDKGASVLRMIERYLGGDVFRQGLHLYLDKHRLSNTSTTDLWDALEEASGQPVRATMGTWVYQPGFPLVSVEGAGDNRTLRLSQHRFLLDGSRGQDEMWAVPISLRYATEGGEVHQVQLLLEGPEATVELTGEPAWVLVNEEAWGTYRVNYSDDLRRRLYGALGHLTERERLSLVSDTWAATVAGLLPLSASLTLWEALADDDGPDLWVTIASALGLLSRICDDNQLPQVEALVRRLAGPAQAALGWEPTGTDQDNPRRARLRARLLSVMGTLGADKAIRDEARRRLAEADAGSGPQLPPDLATAVAELVAAGGGAEQWDSLYSHFKHGATPQDESRYLLALAGFSDPVLVQRSIDLALSDEVRTQDAPYLLGSVLSHRDGSRLAWDVIEEHLDEMLERWPSKAILRMFEALPALVATGEAQANRALDWLDTHPEAGSGRRMQQCRERLLINLAFKQRISAELGTILADQAPEAS
jgi:puromycin-sensitive aminopeptidase